jgi:hypothetical protein
VRRRSRVLHAATKARATKSVSSLVERSGATDIARQRYFSRELRVTRTSLDVHRRVIRLRLRESDRLPGINLTEIRTTGIVPALFRCLGIPAPFENRRPNFCFVSRARTYFLLQVRSMFAVFIHVQSFQIILESERPSKQSSGPDLYQVWLPLSDPRCPKTGEAPGPGQAPVFQGPSH